MARYIVINMYDDYLHHTTGLNKESFKEGSVLLFYGTSCIIKAVLGELLVLEITNKPTNGFNAFILKQFSIQPTKKPKRKVDHVENTTKKQGRRIRKLEEENKKNSRRLEKLEKDLAKHKKEVSKHINGIIEAAVADHEDLKKMIKDCKDTKNTTMSEKRWNKEYVAS